MKRFCDLCAEASKEIDSLQLARLIGKLEILAEICTETYALPSLCESLKQEVVRQKERLESLVLPASTETETETLVETVPTPKIFYKQEYVRCGKEKCRKCADRIGHGPYWYTYTFTNGQSRKRYVGLNLPENLPTERTVVRYATPLKLEETANTRPCGIECEANCEPGGKPCASCPKQAN